MGPVLLATGLVVYNSAANGWAPFRGWAYVPMNIAATVAVAAVGTGPLGLSATQVGFGAGWGSDALLGLGIGAALAVPVFIAAMMPRTRRLVADERVRGLGGPRLLYRGIVRIPVGTALLEELSFRGVLYGAWRPHGVLVAVFASAVPFGLWHISPTINLLDANRPGARPRSQSKALLGAVVFTTAAGIGFAALREAGGTLGIPLGLHMAINSLATVAAVLALRSSLGR